MQLIHTIKNLWEKKMLYNNGNCKSLLLLNHHLIKNNQLHDVEKLNAQELCSFPILFTNTKPNSRNTFKIFSVLRHWCGLIFTVNMCYD